MPNTTADRLANIRDALAPQRALDILTDLDPVTLLWVMHYLSNALSEHPSASARTAGNALAAFVTEAQLTDAPCSV